MLYNSYTQTGSSALVGFPKSLSLKNIRNKKYIPKENMSGTTPKKNDDHLYFL